MCRKWRDASTHPRFTKRVNAANPSITRAISESVAGGTVLVAPGYYQVHRPPSVYKSVKRLPVELNLANAWTLSGDGGGVQAHPAGG